MVRPHGGIYRNRRTGAGNPPNFSGISWGAVLCGIFSPLLGDLGDLDGVFDVIPVFHTHGGGGDAGGFHLPQGLVDGVEEEADILDH